MNPLKTFTISVRPFYDQYNKCYKNILVINGYPQGPLNSLVRRIQFNDLSPYQKYQNNSPCNYIEKCGLALANIEYYHMQPIFYNDSDMCCNKFSSGSGCNLMSPNEINNLISFLLNNGYQIETQITNMLNNSPIKPNNLTKNGFTATYYGTNQPNITYMR
jgi:hypothetical protein